MPAVLALVIGIGVTLGAGQGARQPGVDLQGKLYKAVFTSGTGVLGSADLATLPEPLRARLSAYLTRRSAFRSQYQGKAESFETAAIDGKKRVIERAIASLFDSPGIQQAAAEFVSSAPIVYDWAASASAPAGEAAYAEDVLKKNPSSPIAPYLYAFIAHRQRAAFEVADRQQDVETMKGAAKKYRAFIDRLRNVQDPIFPLLADDLDRQPHVYVASDKHPRDFNPDA